ncbi:hypothetical protein [Burkholderia vietnamiensis]|nr:hypothetical protein [Burkholderia vietnamiensis]
MADVRVPVSTLKWIGDSLFCGGDPALFQFMRSDGAIEIMLLEECLKCFA